MSGDQIQSQPVQRISIGNRPDTFANQHSQFWKARQKPMQDELQQVYYILRMRNSCKRARRSRAIVLPGLTLARFL